MNWKQLYFGKVTPAEVFKAIEDDRWQEVRKSMKGMSTKEKYDTLLSYYNAEKKKCKTKDELRMLQVRVTNYVTALSRGGIIKPSDYRD